MQKSPLLKVILFFCLILIGTLKVPVSGVFAAGPGCIQILGYTKNLAPNTLDFNSILFYTNMAQEYKGCIRPIGMGEYNSDGWAWNDNLGWLSLAARVNSQNPNQMINSGVIVNSALEYGVNIKKTLKNGVPRAKLVGYIWGDNAGWIKMNCTRDTSINYDSDHCSQQNYGVEVDFSRPVKGLNDYYRLKGYAWNPHYGYIDFSGVAIAVPDVNFDFVPSVKYIDGEDPNYANGVNTDQRLEIQMFSRSNPKENVTAYFDNSPFNFCLIFDDQRTLDGVRRFAPEFDLDDNRDCTAHTDTFLNILDSNAGFVFDAQKNAFVIGLGELKTFLSTEGGDLDLAYIKIYSNDPSVGAQYFPVQDVQLNFVPPYEVYISKGDYDTFEATKEAYSDGVLFDYNSADNQNDNFTLGVKLFRGELLESNTFSFDINIGSSDNDLLNLTVNARLPDLDSDSDPKPIVQENLNVNSNFSPAFTIGDEYDTGRDEFVVPLSLNLSKFLSAVPDNILATSVDVDVKYPFNNGNNDSKLMASMVRSNNFETFESFMKGFIQDRAFNSVFDDKEASTNTNYAKFKSLINRELSQGNFARCSLADLSSDACQSVDQNLIVIENDLNESAYIKLSDVYRGVLNLSQVNLKTVVLKGFDVFVDDNFVSENPFGIVVLADGANGGRMYVDYGVTSIVKLFAYLDRNMMSVDGLADVNLALSRDLAGVGVGEVTDSKSFNQLVFNGQLVSNNCSGCSRASGENEGQSAKFADGRLVTNDNDLLLAQQEDLNMLRYSPLVLNVRRDGRFLDLLNCDNTDAGMRVLRGMFVDGLSLDKLCFMPERLGFDIKFSELAENFPKNKQRSFMLFYADPSGLPVFSRVKR